MILQTYRFLWVFSFIEIFHVNMTSNEFCKCSLGYVYLRHFGCPMTTIDTSQTIDGNVRSAFVIVGVCYSFFLFRSSSPPILTMPVFNEPVRQIHRKIEPIACPLIPKTDHLIRSNVKTIITGNFEILNANRLFFEAFTKKLLCEQLSSLC